MAVCTSAQHNLIRVLMRELELPIDRISVMHRTVFFDAGIPWNEGREVCAEVSALTTRQASALIRQLKARNE